jgi:hypothetical protein
MCWEGGVDLIALTGEGIAMPNVILHVARMVHTPVGSAPGGMIFWQPDPAAPPQAFGFVSSSEEVGDYFGKNIFAGTPFEDAPTLLGSINISAAGSEATARIELPGFVFEMRHAGLGQAARIDRAPIATAPFHQQGLEAVATTTTLKVNGADIPLVIPSVGITGGPCAVFAACGIYSR